MNILIGDSADGSRDVVRSQHKSFEFITNRFYTQTLTTVGKNFALTEASNKMYLINYISWFVTATTPASNTTWYIYDSTHSQYYMLGVIPLSSVAGKNDQILFQQPIKLSAGNGTVWNIGFNGMASGSAYINVGYTELVV